MTSIFIDANILLGFWSLREGRISSDLLLPLVEMRDQILLTEQVSDEVTRNKLRVFLENVGAFSISVPPMLPDNLVRCKEISRLNVDLNRISNDVSNVKKNWESTVAQLADDISSNTDLTSKMLEPLISSAVAPTEDQLAAARNRRERGNPPGKKAGPLGDQISWQQFLDVVDGQKTVWIITRDSDFTETIGKQRHLNPFLRSELAKLGVERVETHDNLAGAMKALRAAGVGATMPLDEAKLTELEKQEAQAHHPQPPYLTWPDTPWECQMCRHINVHSGLTAHPSQYGGWSYWARCSSCGYRFDTGEPYDG